MRKKKKILIGIVCVVIFVFFGILIIFNNKKVDNLEDFVITKTGEHGNIVVTYEKGKDTVEMNGKDLKKGTPYYYDMMKFSVAYDGYSNQHVYIQHNNVKNTFCKSTEDKNTFNNNTSEKECSKVDDLSYTVYRCGSEAKYNAITSPTDPDLENCIIEGQPNLLAPESGSTIYITKDDSVKMNSNIYYYIYILRLENKNENQNYKQDASFIGGISVDLERKDVFLSKNWYYISDIDRTNVLAIDVVLTDSPPEIYTFEGKDYTRFKTVDVSGDESDSLKLSAYSSFDEETAQILLFTSREKPKLPVDSSGLLGGSDYNEYNNIKYIDFSNFDTKHVNDMGCLFCEIFHYGSNKVSLNVTGWDTSNVTNMSSMFYQVYGKGKIIGLSSWDTSNVTDMFGMFDGFDFWDDDYTIDLSEWNTSNLKNMGHMFEGVGINATSININLSGWDTSNVTDMSSFIDIDSYAIASINIEGFTFDSIPPDEQNHIFCARDNVSLTVSSIDVRDWIKNLPSLNSDSCNSEKKYSWDNSNFIINP